MMFLWLGLNMGKMVCLSGGGGGAMIFFLFFSFSLSLWLLLSIVGSNK